MEINALNDTVCVGAGPPPLEGEGIGVYVDTTTDVRPLPPPAGDGEDGRNVREISAARGDRDDVYGE